MRKVVVLPQPDGPTSTTNSRDGDFEIQRRNDGDVAEGLGDAFEA